MNRLITSAEQENHIVVSSTGEIVIDAALLGGRNPASTHVHARFSGSGTKTLTIAGDLADSSVNGMLITVSAFSSSNYDLRIQVVGGTFDGASGIVQVRPSSSGASGFVIAKSGSSASPAWNFACEPLL